MTRAILQRLESGDEGTFGRLEFNGKTLCTGELPWRDNADDRSCIPAGTYRCEWTFSPRFERKTYQVMAVPDRDGIRFHAGNKCGNVDLGFVSHVEGCILLGKTRGTLEGQQAVLGSKPAVAEFEAEMAGAPFDLEIRDPA